MEPPKSTTYRAKESRKETWGKHLDSCVLTYNASWQESTLYSPFEVIFGQLARFPAELDTDNKEANCYRKGLNFAANFVLG